MTQVFPMKNHLYRQRQLLKKNHVSFCSNDYLNFSTHPRIQTFFQKGFARYPVGSGGSMLIAGYHKIHKTLESAFANFLQTDSAVLMNSGYVANLSIMQLLAANHDTCIIDKTLHASFYDGLRLANVPFERYPHQNYEYLKQNWHTQILCIESVFSMTGHQPSLAHLATWNRQAMIVDEAHAFGLFGEKGQGLVHHAHLTQEKVPLRVIPLGKAFGAQGAIIAGQKAWIQALIQVARGYIYSTGMSPAYAYGLYKTLLFLNEAHDLREKLFNQITYFKQLITTDDRSWDLSTTPIQFLKMGCSKKALHIAHWLHQHGFFVRAIRPPTVPEHRAGIRISLNVNHTQAHIEQLLETIQTYFDHDITTVH